MSFSLDEADEFVCRMFQIPRPTLKKKFSPQLIHNLTTSYPHCP